MTAHIGSGGSFKQFQSGSSGTGTAIGSGSSWKSIEGMWIGSGGAWKKFFEGFTLFLEPTGYTISSFDATSADSLLRLETNGELITAANGSETSRTDAWGRPLGSGAGDDYECRLTKSSGTDPTTGPALSTWHALTSNRQWVWVQSSSGTKEFDGTLEVRHTGGTPSDSCSIDVSCTVT